MEIEIFLGKKLVTSIVKLDLDFCPEFFRSIRLLAWRVSLMLVEIKISSFKAPISATKVSMSNLTIED